MVKINLKKMLLPLALSLGIVTQASGLELENCPIKGYPVREEKQSKLETYHYENLGMLIQNCGLIYEDIYKYTKPGIKDFEYGNEGNPVARKFFKALARNPTLLRGG